MGWTWNLTKKCGKTFKELPEAGEIALVLVIVFVPVLVAAMAADLLLNFGRGCRSLWEMRHLRAKQKKDALFLERLAAERVEPYVADPMPNLGNSAHLEAICQEIVRDQLGRTLLPVEKVSIFAAKPIAGRDSTLVTFIYKRYEHSVKDGVSRDVLITSAHVVRLSANEIAGCVDVVKVLSLTHTELSGVDNPGEYIHAVSERVIPDLMIGVSEWEYPQTPSITTPRRSMSPRSESE